MRSFLPKLKEILYNRKNSDGRRRIMSQEDGFFQGKKVNSRKLQAYGFKENVGVYSYDTKIMQGDFQLTVTISKKGQVETNLLELACEEEYILHRTSAAGSFVGAVRSEYQSILQDIADKCFESDSFKNESAKEVINYIRDTYQDELEFLWPKTPGNAIFRRKETKKWYAVLLTVQRNKLGLPSDEQIEILDLRNQSEKVAALIEKQNYYPGYHMNKKYWLTICLDGTVPFKEIKLLIDESYQLALK